MPSLDGIRYYVGTIGGMHYFAKPVFRSSIFDGVGTTYILYPLDASVLTIDHPRILSSPEALRAPGDESQWRKVTVTYHVEIDPSPAVTK